MTETDARVQKEVAMMSEYESQMNSLRRKFLIVVLEEHGCDQCTTAAALGIHRNTLSRLMKKCGLNAWDVKRAVKSERGSGDLDNVRLPAATERSA